MKRERETIFNIIYSGIVDLFQLSVTSLTAYSRENGNDIRYDWYKKKTHPNSDNFNEFMDEFMQYFKEKCKEESLVNAKDSLEGLFRFLVTMKRNKGIECDDIHAQGTYHDVEVLLEEAYYAISDVAVAEELYPKVHFDSRLLIPSQCVFGRAEFIKYVIKELRENRVYLYGIGGIGKTEIVKSVVNTILNAPIGSSYMLVRDIYWIIYDNCKDGDDVKDCIIKSIKPQTMINDDNRNVLYEECIHIINKKRTLLIIDNIEIFSNELLAFINRVQNVRLLVVGRPEPIGGNPLLNVEVQKLDLNACMELFAFYCPYNEDEKNDVAQIVELADRHTISLELLAKLIKKQEKTISEFLQVLIDRGFNFRFDGEEEQKVSSAHSLLEKEDRIIVQLAKLFNTIHLTEKEKNLLIKFSTVPNLKCATQNACKWFALSDTGVLYSLANAGWIKREEGERNRNRWYIHSIIATAIRFAYSNILLATCQPFIYKIADIIVGALEQSKKVDKMLIQFGWSISDIFRDSFQSVSDVHFLYVLAKLYERIGLLQRAEYIVNLAMELADRLSV